MRPGFDKKKGTQVRARVAIAGGLVFLVSSLTVSTALATHIACQGTGVPHQYLGDGGANVMNGNGMANAMAGQGGDDAMAGNGGADKVCGNQGGDSLFGNNGNDKVDGQENNDGLVDGLGLDELWGRGGADAFFLCNDPSDPVDTVHASPGEPIYTGSSYC